MINILTKGIPHDDLCLFLRGPLDGERHLVPKNKRHLSCGMPFGGKMAVYDPQVENGVTTFVFDKIV